MIEFAILMLIALEWWSVTFWRNVVLVLAAVASVVTSIGIINAKVIAPLIAKPLANALRKELTELIEVTILSDELMGQLNDQIEEVVSKESALLVREMGLLQEEVRLVKTRLGQLEQLQLRLHAENRKNN